MEKALGGGSPGGHTLGLIELLDQMLGFIADSLLGTALAHSKALQGEDGEAPQLPPAFPIPVDDTWNWGHPPPTKGGQTPATAPQKAPWQHRWGGGLTVAPAPLLDSCEITAAAELLGMVDQSFLQQPVPRENDAGPGAQVEGENLTVGLAELWGEG